MYKITARQGELQKLRARQVELQKRYARQIKLNYEKGDTEDISLRESRNKEILAEPTRHQR
jgi:hypothetical protein